MKRAVCNELFGSWDFVRSVRTLRECGFQGVEIAPHTLFGDFSGSNADTLREIRRVLDGEGVAFAGLHWLLVGPEGLHVTAVDSGVRQRSWDHIRRLAEIGGELGGGPMTLGSPAQRSSPKEMDSKEARNLFIDGLISVADDVAAAGCRLLPEALPSEFTDVMNTLAEAREVIDAVNRPGITGMFDFHNTDDETEEWDALIREHAEYIAHVHLNDSGGTVPRDSRREYREAFAALKEIGYHEWISLEIFTEPENPGESLEGVAAFLDEVDASPNHLRVGKRR